MWRKYHIMSKKTLSLDRSLTFCFTVMSRLFLFSVYVDRGKIFDGFFVHFEIDAFVFVSVDLINGDGNLLFPPEMTFPQDQMGYVAAFFFNEKLINPPNMSVGGVNLCVSPDREFSGRDCLVL